MAIVGIDPGLGGAVAYVIGSFAGVSDTPTTEIHVGKRTRRVYLPAEMVELLAVYNKDDTHVFLEAVHSMPGQGVSSTFSFGRGFGLWEGILAALRLPYTLVAPQRWKQVVMRGMSRDKGASRIVAQRLYPRLHEQLAHAKDHGRADALLIAAYGSLVMGHGKGGGANGH